MEVSRKDPYHAVSWDGFSISWAILRSMLAFILCLLHLENFILALGRQTGDGARDKSDK